MRNTILVATVAALLVTPDARATEPSEGIQVSYRTPSPRGISPGGAGQPGFLPGLLPAPREPVTEQRQTQTGWFRLNAAMTLDTAPLRTAEAIATANRANLRLTEYNWNHLFETKKERYVFGLDVGKLGKGGGGMLTIHF